MKTIISISLVLSSIASFASEIVLKPGQSAVICSSSLVNLNASLAGDRIKHYNHNTYGSHSVLAEPPFEVSAPGISNRDKYDIEYCVTITKPKLAPHPQNGPKL